MCPRVNDGPSFLVLRDLLEIMTGGSGFLPSLKVVARILDPARNRSSRSSLGILLSVSIFRVMGVLTGRRRLVGGAFSRGLEVFGGRVFFSTLAREALRILGN